MSKVKKLVIMVMTLIMLGTSVCMAGDLVVANKSQGRR